MPRKILISICHALVLLALHVLYFNANWSLPLEEELMTAVSKTETFFKGRGRFADSNFLFINTAYDNQLLRVETEAGDSGNLVITDRLLLAQLLQQLANHGNGHKYLFCDLLFDQPSPHDSMLQAQLHRVKKMMLPAGSNRQNQLVRPIFVQQWAPAQYVTFEGMVTKIRLYASGMKTLPLRMYEQCRNRHIIVGWAGLWEGRRYAPLAIYPRYFFDQHAVEKRSITLRQAVHLLQASGPAAYQHLLQNKMVVLGDLTTPADRHPTPVGHLPGSIIMLNTYLTLEAQYHLHGWLWAFFVLVCFGLLAFHELYYKSHGRHSNKKWQALLNFLQLSGLCLFISVASSLLFNLHSTVLPVILYFECLLFVKSLFHTKPAL